MFNEIDTKYGEILASLRAVEARLDAAEKELERLHGRAAAVASSGCETTEQLIEAVAARVGLFKFDVLSADDIILQMHALHPDNPAWYPYDARDRKIGAKRILGKLYHKAIYTTYIPGDKTETYARSGKKKYGDSVKHALYIVRDYDKYKGIPGKTLYRECERTMYKARRELGESLR